MGRKTLRARITSDEKTAQINPKNLRLKDDFLMYLNSLQRSPGTIAGYDNDLLIVLTYVLEKLDNKEFREITRRDLVGLQNWLISHGNSSARIRRIKSTLSSLSSYCEDILSEEDPDYAGYRSVVKKIKNPPLAATREKTIWKDEELEALLDFLEYSPSYIEQSGNDLLVSLNDIHYGADYSNYWGVYNSTVCAQMMASYLEKILQVAKIHHSQNCIIWENGDAISGSIHKTIQITNKENVIAQIMGVSELIAQFIEELSKHFATVSFVSVAGNHSRLDPSKDDALLDERLDDLVEWYLKARLHEFENVQIGAGEKIDPTMYLINVRGQNYIGVHGDMDGSAAQIQSLQTMVGKPVYAVLSGHLHHNKIDTVQGIKTIMAGSFLGMDDYCLRKRIYGVPEQLICVCDETGVVCSYDAPLR